MTVLPGWQFSQHAWSHLASPTQPPLPPPPPPGKESSKVKKNFKQVGQDVGKASKLLEKLDLKDRKKR